MHVDLSAAKLILCDQQGKEYSIKHPEMNVEKLISQQISSIETSACFGNTLLDAWRYLYVIGTNTSSCVPYNKKYGQFEQLEKLGTFTEIEKMPICSQVTGPLGDMCTDFTYDFRTAEETGTPAKFYKALHIYANCWNI